MASDETHDLAEVGLLYARAVSTDLAALTGVEVSLKGPNVEYVDKTDLLKGDEPIGYARCVSQEADDEFFLFVLPRPEAATLACLLMGQSEERINDLRMVALDDDNLDAFNEVLNLSAAVLSRLFTDKLGLAAVKLHGIAVEVDAPLIDKNWLAPGSHYVARYRLIIPGFPEGTFDLVLSPAAAKNWFDLAPKPERGAASAIDTSEPGEEVDESITLVVIDSLEEHRNELEDLEDDLGCSVWALDPDEVDASQLEEFSDVGCFLIEWELGPRPGLDLVEMLRSDELTASKPIIMISEKPTEGRVRAAIRGGADGFAMKPCTARGLQEQIARVRAQARERAQTVG